MKKFLLTGIISVLTIFCTACVKVDYNIEIDNKDNIKITQTNAVNLESLKAFDENIDEKIQEELKKDKTKYEQKGYKVETYQESPYTGITLSKSNIKFKDFKDNLPKEFQNNDSNEFSIKKSAFKNKYKIHLVTQLNDLSSSSSLASEEFSQDSDQDNQNNDDTIYSDGRAVKVVSRTRTTDPATGNIIETKKYEDGTVLTSSYNPAEQEKLSNAFAGFAQPVINLTIKIPTKATKNNATKVINDKEYQWNLADKNQPVDISLEYEKYNVINIIIGIVAIIIAILLFVK